MKIVRICIALRGLDVSKVTQQFTHGDFDLVNKGASVINDFANPQLVNVIGLHTFKDILNSTVFYVALDCPDEIADNPMRVTIPGIDKIDLFISSLWFVKDNSCNVKGLYSFVRETETYNILTTNGLYTNCACCHDETEFSYEELERANSILTKLISIVESKKFDKEIYENEIKNVGHDSIHMGIVNKVDYNIKNRIERAFLFLKLARGSAFSLMKISLYMNIYECLFTTDANEIIHKMSERVACYYTSDKAMRLHIYKLIKKCYTIRSRYFHGKELDKNNKFEDIPKTLVELDNLTREILTKIIMYDSDIFLKPDLEPWFMELIFK